MGNGQVLNELRSLQVVDNNLEQQQSSEVEEKLSFIEFNLGQDRYAIPLDIVREVLSIPETTNIPNAPDYFVGMMNLRGLVITVLDPRVKLKITPLEDSSENAVIVVQIGQLTVGVIVDTINEVINILPREIGSVPPMNQQIKTEYVSGVISKGEDIALLLDIGRALDLERVATLRQM